MQRKQSRHHNTIAAMNLSANMFHMIDMRSVPSRAFNDGFSGSSRFLAWVIDRAADLIEIV